MRISLGRKAPSGAIGLDLDGAYIAAVQVTDGRIQRAASAELPPGLITDGEVRDTAELGKALRDFVRAHDLPRRARLGVANQQIVVRTLELPKVDDERDRAMAVRFQAAEAIAMPLEETVFDYQVVSEAISLDGTARMRVVVVAARESMVMSLVEAVRSAGLKPEAIDLNAFALVRTLASTSTPGVGSRVYCHLGSVTNLAVAHGTSCLFTRPLSATRDEVGELQPGSLAEEIRLSIDYYMAQPDARPVEQILLAGPGASRAELAGELSALIGLPVSVPEPLVNLDVGDLPAAEAPSRHTVAAGLALGAAS